MSGHLALQAYDLLSRRSLEPRSRARLLVAHVLFVNFICLVSFSFVIFLIFIYLFTISFYFK